MKKVSMALLMVFGMLSATTALRAQDNDGPLRMGIGINGGTTLKDPTKVVLGADVRLQKSFGNSLSGILTTGYYHFLKSDKSGAGFGIIPLKAGVKIFPVKNVYVAGEVGAGFGTKEDMGTAFIYSPSVGLAFGSGFDISLKYEGYAHKDWDSYANQLALRLAYGFKL